MGAFRLCLALSLVTATMPIPLPAKATVRYPPSHLQVAREKMSPDARRDDIVADLTTVLSGPGISWTEVATTPYLTNQDRLCRRDVVRLSYISIGKTPSGPLKPRGISAVYPQYHLIDGEGTGSRADWEKACARQSGNRVYWASGDDDDHFAAGALSRLGTAVTDVRENARVKIECGDPDGNSQGPDGSPQDFKCDGPTFLDAVQKVSRIHRCVDPMKDECYQFSMGDYAVTIIINFSNDTHSTLIKMSSGEDIILT